MFTAAVDVAAADPIVDCISKIMSDFNSLFVCQLEEEREKWREREIIRD